MTSNNTRLLDLPRDTWCKTSDGTKFKFHHIDGMYSYCSLPDGEVFHLCFDYVPPEVLDD